MCWILGRIWQHCHFNNIEFSNPWKWYISPFGQKSWGGRPDILTSMSNRCESHNYCSTDNVKVGKNSSSPFSLICFPSASFLLKANLSQAQFLILSLSFSIQIFILFYIVLTVKCDNTLSNVETWNCKRSGQYPFWGLR